jgi:hypothetical protein
MGRNSKGEEDEEGQETEKTDQILGYSTGVGNSD